MHCGPTAGKITPLTESPNCSLAKVFVSMFSRLIPTKYAEYLAPVAFYFAAFPLPLVHLYFFLFYFATYGRYTQSRNAHGDGGTTSFWPTGLIASPGNSHFYEYTLRVPPRALHEVLFFGVGWMWGCHRKITGRRLLTFLRTFSLFNISTLLLL